MLIRNVSNNAITKIKMEYMRHQNKNEPDIENRLAMIDDGALYDIILTTRIQYDDLAAFKIRYLNYVSINCTSSMTLNHPEYLQSASQSRVSISNLDQCTGLRNLLSKHNTYCPKQIQGLQQLQRLYSVDDVYEGQDACMLQTLFNNAKLLYVCVFKGTSGRNVAGPMTIDRNTEELRYLSIDNYTEQIRVVMDISSIYPRYLQWF